MSADNNTDGGTALTLAAIGSGAVLLWLYLRGRGWRGGRGARGNTEPRTPLEIPELPQAVCVRILSDERIMIDHVESDLATVVARARAVAALGTVYVLPRGDARQSWVETVL